MPPAAPTPEPRLSVCFGGFAHEGGFNGPGEPQNNWARFEAVGWTEPSGLAAGGWREPAQGLEAAASLGVGGWTTTLEWARLESEPGRRDAAAIDRYGQMLQAGRSLGLSPEIRLWDATHPNWLGEEFWLYPGAPERFVAHVDQVVDDLGIEAAERWVVMTDPVAVALQGWMTGQAPPGRRMALRDSALVLDQLLCAAALGATRLLERGATSVVAVELGAGPGNIQERVAAQFRSGRVSTAPPPRRLDLLAPGPGHRLASVLERVGTPLKTRRLTAQLRPRGVAPTWQRPTHLVEIAAELPDAPRPWPAGEPSLVDGRASTVLRGIARPGGAISMQDLLDHRRRDLLDDAQRSLILDSLVDGYRDGRWSTATGIFALDRARGAEGFTWRSVDAAGRDAAQAVRALAAALGPTLN